MTKRDPAFFTVPKQVFESTDLVDVCGARAFVSGWQPDGRQLEAGALASAVAANIEMNQVSAASALSIVQLREFN